MNSVTENADERVVVARDVWNTSADRAEQTMAAVRKENLSKTELMDRLAAFFGLRDVPISLGDTAETARQ